jgi:hypothetical protein
MISFSSVFILELMVVVSFMVTLRVLPLPQALPLHLRLNPLLLHPHRRHPLRLHPLRLHPLRLHTLRHHLLRPQPLHRVQVMGHLFRALVSAVVKVGPVVLPVSVDTTALPRIHVSPVLLPGAEKIHHTKITFNQSIRNVSPTEI